MAAPIEVDEPEMDSPWRPPYTVDTLFELPETDQCFEVLEGKLIVSPAPTTEHNGCVDWLHRLFARLVPAEVWLLSNTAVRLPNRDGPIPDLLVTSVANLSQHPKGLPGPFVHTVVEVVSPSNAVTDRVTKTRLYAEAGIPCYWRIEQRRWKEHFAPVPAIVVRLRGEDGEWQQTIAAAGTISDLPIVVDEHGTIVTVKIDPAMLVGKRTT